jgi:hypothetical protein
MNKKVENFIIFILIGSESRGGCKKCGMLGHLTFQCRNNIKLESSKPDEVL